MRRLLPLAVSVFLLSSCGPPLVWGGDGATKTRLLHIVPFGSTIADLETKAKAREWQMFYRDDRSFPKGESAYFSDGCEFQGGVSRTIIVAEYGVFTTSVETLWLFDGNGKLGNLCIRRTTDTL
ncbi:MAG: hypothetical protein QFC78_03870 [Pseudomonadota bacterium]|nr:hypothetical protein [Pseudomonadota bacterium]